MTIAAKYEHGVFKPLQPVKMDEGTMVEVHVLSSAARLAEKSRSVKDFEFCGMWSDREDLADSIAYVNDLRRNLRG
jgi:predicted DNA-binding antitoxin AbrB/MazE fold protein